MANFELVQATKSNGIWDRLNASWEKQIKDFKADPAWVRPHLEHGAKIVSEDGKDPNYGIYVVCGSRSGSPVSPYEAFVHVGWKLPKTSAAELRLVWNRLAPHFQFEGDIYQVTEVQTAIIYGALKIAQKHPRKPPLKMFLGNATDRNFGRNFALVINGMPASPISAVVKGGWLHISS